VDVFRRRSPEEASILTAELRRAQISNAPARVPRIYHRGQHEAPRFLKPQRFLVLQRAHGRDGFELPVKGGGTHVHQAGQLFDFDGLVEMCPYPGHCLRDSLHTGIRLADLCDPATYRAAEQPDQNLIDHERREELGVHRLRHQLEQPRRSIDDVRVRLPYIEGAVVSRLRQTVRKHLRSQLSDLLGIEVDLESQVRLRVAGLRDLSSHGHIDRVHGDLRRSVAVDVLADHHAFRSLSDDAHGRPHEGMRQLRVRSGAADGVHTGGAQLEAPVVPGMSADVPGQPGDIGFFFVGG
jgi:hypothetical protein